VTEAEPVHQIVYGAYLVTHWMFRNERQKFSRESLFLKPINHDSVVCYI